MTVLGWTLIAYVVIERLVELVIDRRNRRMLLAKGAHEVGADHYPAMVAMHVSWLASVVAWAIFGNVVFVPLLAVLYGVVQPLRFWVMASLGPYWTTRIITLPDAPLVKRGPYRFLKHPNYVVVVLEVALLPLALGAWSLAVLFSLLNAAMLWRRISVENTALAVRSHT